MRQVACFGLSLVKLDIRQESERHVEVVDAITQYLGLGSYRDWPEEERQVCSVHRNLRYKFVDLVISTHHVV